MPRGGLNIFERLETKVRAWNYSFDEQFFPPLLFSFFFFFALRFQEIFQGGRVRSQREAGKFIKPYLMTNFQVSNGPFNSWGRVVKRIEWEKLGIFISARNNAANFPTNRPRNPCFAAPPHPPPLRFRRDQIFRGLISPNSTLSFLLVRSTEGGAMGSN